MQATTTAARQEVLMKCLTKAQTALLLEALNSHEGVLSTEWEQARLLGGDSSMTSIAGKLHEVSILAAQLMGHAKSYA